MNVYFISGLGADERVFGYLNLPNIHKVFIQWIPPCTKETLSQYARRLLEQIDISEEVILVGISFGGIIAQEISKIIKCSKVIIISSIKTSYEFSIQLNIVRKTKLHRLFPANFLILSNLLTAKYYFGISSSSELQLLKRIIKDTDRNFMLWAIDAIMNWNNKNYSREIVHIHGTKDRIFPISKINDCIKIKGGGHFMIVSLSLEIEKELLKTLTSKHELKNS